MKRPFTIIFLGTFIPTILAIIVACVYIWRPRRDLDHFLREVSKVEVGKSTLADWQGQSGQSQLASLMFACNQDTTCFGLRTENKLLHELRLAPLAVVDVSVAFKDGVASEVYILLVVKGNDDKGQSYGDMGVVVRETTERPSACHPGYNLLTHQRSGVWATVGMDSCVSPENRAQALAINTSCLTKIGGCKTVEAMIPRVFAHPSP